MKRLTGLLKIIKIKSNETINSKNYKFQFLKVRDFHKVKKMIIIFNFKISMIKKKR